MPTPEDQARETIDALLTQAGWIIQDPNQVNLSAGRGVVIRNFPLHGAILAGIKDA
jgi:type I restriction enzyme R subunit